MRLLFTRFIPARAKLRFGRPYALCNSSCDNRISVSARACKEGSHVIALRYCFVEESIHEICHDNVSGRNCKLSLCKMLVLLRVDFSSGRGSGEGQIAKGTPLFGLNGDVRLNEACF